MKTGLPSLVRVCVILTLLLTLALNGQSPTTAQARSDTVAPAASDGAAALIFIENAGQFPDGARFQVRGAPQGTIWLAEDAIWLTIIESPSTHDARSHFDWERAGSQPSDELRQAAAIKLSFVGANPQPRIEPFDSQETHVSFFIGNDPAQWRADVPAWGGVHYLELYTGIDLELSGGPGGLVPRLVARPGADLGAVRLRVEGADALVVEDDALRLSTAAGEASWPLPRVKGMEAAVTIESAGSLAFDIVAQFSAARPSRPSAIKDRESATPNSEPPSGLLYGTFLGGSGMESGKNIAVDGSGAAYVIGITNSSNFPTTPGALYTNPIGYNDAFVAKLNADGSALDYATFLGGSSYDQGHDIAVDASGAAYIIGWTQSPDFPVTPGAFDTSLGLGDAFVAKLNADGSALDYATFLGGTKGEGGAAIAVDGSGAAYVAGGTSSSDFPVTVGAFDTVLSGNSDGFVAKLNMDGSALDYATFLGGRDGDSPIDIAVDASGAAYIAGYTQGMPTTPDSFDPTYNGGYYDAFVVKLNAAGSAMVYGTFLGGEGYDEGYGIAVDESGAAYVTGHTASSDFPTTSGAFDPTDNGGWDAFVVKLNTAGSALTYATLLGGNGHDYAYGIAVDGSGMAYLTGYLTDYDTSSDFPVTCGFDWSYNGAADGFVAKLNADGSALDYASFLGGSLGDYPYGIAVDANGGTYVTGGTDSSDLPTTPNAFDTTYNSNGDAFVVKLAIGNDATPSVCGHVMGIGGQGIPAVTVSAGVAGSAVADSSGAYIIDLEIAGTYTITPTLQGYSFDPVSRTVEVPPDATGQNFEAGLFSVYLPVVLRGY